MIFGLAKYVFAALVSLGPFLYSSYTMSLSGRMSFDNTISNPDLSFFTFATCGLALVILVKHSVRFSQSERIVLATILITFIILSASLASPVLFVRLDPGAYPNLEKLLFEVSTVSILPLETSLLDSGRFPQTEPMRLLALKSDIRWPSLSMAIFGFLIGLWIRIVTLCKPSNFLLFDGSKKT